MLEFFFDLMSTLPLTLPHVLFISGALILFTLVSYYWKIKVYSYLQLMGIVVVMVLSPLFLLLIEITAFQRLVAIIGIEIVLAILIGIQYDEQIGKPYRRMYAAMVRAADNKNLNVSSALNIDITGEMKRLQDKQATFVSDMTEVMESIKAQKDNIEGYLGSLGQKTNVMEEEISTVTDDIDKILQNAAVISEQVDDLRTSGLDFIDKTNADFNSLIEVSNSASRISDQTNIIAVNAAIEAAQTDESSNFSTVADGIQSISKRSKDTTDKLTQSINNLRRSIIREIKELNDGLTKLEDKIFEMGELSNRSSSFAHQQMTYIKDIHDISNQIENSRAKISGHLKLCQLD